MRKLVVALLIATCLSCAPTKRTTRDLVTTGAIDQTMLDNAWKEALKIGGARQDFPLSVPLARVVFVPSSLVMGPYQFYGITNTELMIIDKKLVIVETIEIHLPEALKCHLKQVLIHELLHTVATRRILSDSKFRSEVEGIGNEEEWVRHVYPIEMNLCD